MYVKAKGFLPLFSPITAPHKHTDDTDTGVVTRTVALVWLTGHRLYRTALRTMRPDLTYQSDAAITTDMIVSDMGKVIILRIPPTGKDAHSIMV